MKLGHIVPYELATAALARTTGAFLRFIQTHTSRASSNTVSTAVIGSGSRLPVFTSHQ
jgi:hypothetical protein